MSSSAGTRSVGRFAIAWLTALVLVLRTVAPVAQALSDGSTSRTVNGTTLFTETATLDPAGERTGLADSWGASTFGYDGAGRLSTASYPDGSTEADQYDPAGNRTVITSTVSLTTTVTSNAYDHADELTGAVSTINGTNPQTSTYSYDGNGNQTLSVGPTGTITNTYDLRNDLVGVQGPSTSVSYVLDGQGDRLREYDTSSQNYHLATLVQDVRPEAGLSSLLTDGTNDYAYEGFGSGAAPVVAWGLGTGQPTYLTSDLLGSVRLTTNQSGKVLGAGAYDAWGNARPNTANTNGQLLLAGLEGTQPFGYAGQYLDPGTGSYDMRAREYSPQEGQFESEDPRAPSDTEPVTIDPYEYAGDMPTDVTDASGQDWVFPNPTTPFGDYQQQSAIAGQALGVGTLRGTGVQLDPGEVERALAGVPAEFDVTRFWVPVFKSKPVCLRISSATALNLPKNSFSANIVDLQRHMLWDIEPAGAAHNATTANLNRLLTDANGVGMWWPDTTCNRFDEDTPCGMDYKVGQGLKLGTGYPNIFNLPNAQTIQMTPNQKGTISWVPNHPGDVLLAWQPTNRPGLIEYQVVPVAVSPICGSVLQCLLGAAQVLVFDDLKTAVYSDAPWYSRLLSVVNIASKAALVVPGLGEGVAGARSAGEGAIFAKTVAEGADAAVATADGLRGAADMEDAIDEAVEAERTVEGGAEFCGLCFPAGTQVSTPKGEQAIDTLRVGQSVLAEQPGTGKVEPERVEAVIDDGVKPLIALALGDGSEIRVTSNHPFWVDAGRGLEHAGWVAAGLLRPGDTLRTEAGSQVAVDAVRWNVGEAHVYTLTVANDHDFFAGTARVLVHNAGPCGPRTLTINDEQVGTKIGKHAPDYGFSPRDPSARTLLRDYIQEVFSTPQEIRQGAWHPIGGGGTDYWFFRKYTDVVVTEADGTFVTILHGGDSNGWYTRATEMWP